MEGGRIVQVGTAREIIANPVNEYVQEFVAHMNPLGVLTARDAMFEGDVSGDAIDADTPIKEVLARINEGQTFSVISDGETIGALSESSLLKSLSEYSSGERKSA